MEWQNIVNWALTIWQFSLTQWLIGGLSIGTIGRGIMFLFNKGIKRKIMELYPPGREGVNATLDELCHRRVSPFGNKYLLGKALNQLVQEGQLINRAGYYYRSSDNRF